MRRFVIQIPDHAIIRADVRAFTPQEFDRVASIGFKFDQFNVTSGSLTLGSATNTGTLRFAAATDSSFSMSV